MAQPIDFNALGQVLDTTWGRTSTPVTATQSIKFSLDGDSRMIISYATIVSFVSEVEMIRTKRACLEESDDLIAQSISNVKSSYKNLCGKSINIKEVDWNDSIEIIGFNVHNPKRTAYYRKKVIVEIS